MNFIRDRAKEERTKKEEIGFSLLKIKAYFSSNIDGKRKISEKRQGLKDFHYLWHGKCSAT